MVVAVKDGINYGVGLLHCPTLEKLQKCSCVTAFWATMSPVFLQSLTFPDSSQSDIQNWS